MKFLLETRLQSKSFYWNLGYNPSLDILDELLRFQVQKL